MPKTGLMFEVDNPHFSIELYEDRLEVDLKGTTRNKIEEALEHKPVVRQTLGAVLGLFVPLHIHLSDIDSVRSDKSGNVKIVLPRRRDVTVPLRPPQARKLVRALNDLIPEAKRREVVRTMRQEGILKAAEERLELGRMGATYSVVRSTEVAASAVAGNVEEAEEHEEEEKED